jgi:Enoyl-CoA hydratase/carnithine racemase
MEYSNLLIELKEGIAILTINNPQSLNALNTAILKELNSAIESLREVKDLRVLIITGVGKAFVAGADIKEMSGLNAVSGKEFGRIGSDVFRAIETFDVPVIAAVNGFALGGGCELALACDIRVASENAKFGQPEVGLGIIPGFSGTQRLSKIIGEGNAKELIFTGDIIDAQQAYRVGLVNKIAPAEELLDVAMGIAGKIAKNAPIAVKFAKQAINIGSNVDIDSGIAVENNLFGLCFSTEDQKNGMQAFIKREKCTFENR